MRPFFVLFVSRSSLPAGVLSFISAQLRLVNGHGSFFSITMRMSEAFLLCLSMRYFIVLLVPLILFFLGQDHNNNKQQQQKKRVTYSMSINPDQTSIGVDRHGAGDSSQSNGVITTESQGEGALLEVVGNRCSNRLCDGRDVASVQELANWGIRGRLHKGIVAVAVELDLPVELLQLVQETKLDDLEGTLVNTVSGLECKFIIGVEVLVFGGFSWDEIRLLFHFEK